MSRNLSRRTYFSFLFFVLFFVVTSFLDARPVRAMITLKTFLAIPGDRMVRLEWETASEYNNVGFYISRSSSEDGPYERISTLIAAVEDASAGGEYSLEDRGLQNGQPYYYILESVSSDNRIEKHGPQSAVPGQATLTPTATLTSTLTATATFTQGPTNGTASPTPTRAPTSPPTATGGPYPGPVFSPVPTATRSGAYPAPATTAPSGSAPSPTHSPLRTATPGSIQISPTPGASTPTEGEGAPLYATPTLAPLPSVAIEFPDASPAPSLKSAYRSSSGPMAVTKPDRKPLSASRLLPLGFVTMIWIFLGVWFYFSSRHTR